MQRLTSWWDQLALPRRASTRQSKRKASRSAAPAVRLPPPPPPPPMPPPRENANLMTSSLIYQDPAWKAGGLPAQFPMSGSLTSRQSIRTNPWISRSSLRSSFRPDGFGSDRSRLHVKSFEESTCSSGYGSQDSSPESSVHSPNWQCREDKAIECRSIDLDKELGYLEETSSFGPYDNRRDDLDEEDDEEVERGEEHIYHELESLSRFSRVLADSPSLSSSLPSSSSLSRIPSPIYARPYEGALKRAPLELSNPFGNERVPFSPVPFGDLIPLPRPRMLPLVPHQTFDRPAPKFHPPPPPEEDDEEDSLRKIERDFLAELDAQIAELQMKSEAVRNLVDEARERRQLEQWRRARWHNTFELCL